MVIRTHSLLVHQTFSSSVPTVIWIMWHKSGTLMRNKGEKKCKMRKKLEGICLKKERNGKEFLNECQLHQTFR